MGAPPQAEAAMDPLSDLGLDPTLTVRSRGRSSVPLDITYERDLAPEDLLLLGEGRPTAKAPPLKAIRAQHHTLAMAIASGKRPAEIVALTGYSASRLSILKADPTFAELVAYYQANKELAYQNLHENLARVGHTALQLLEERMVEDPDKLTDDTLIDLAKLGADRTGHGPQTKSTNINLNVDLAGRMERARARHEAFQREGVLPHSGNNQEGQTLDLVALPPALAKP